MQIIDSSNKILLDTEYDNIRKPDVNKSYIVSKNVNDELINKSDKLIIPIKYIEISNKKLGIYYFVYKDKMADFFIQKVKKRIPIGYKYFKILQPINSNKVKDITRFLAKKNDNFEVIDLNNTVHKCFE